MRSDGTRGIERVLLAMDWTLKLLEAEEKKQTENFLHKPEEKLVFNNKIKRKEEKEKKKMQSQERLQKENKLNESKGLESSASNKDCHKVKLPKKMRLQASKSLTTKNGKESSKEKFCGCNIYPNYEKAIAAEYRKTEKEKAKAAAKKKVLKEETKGALWEETDKHICNKIQRKEMKIEKKQAQLQKKKLLNELLEVESNELSPAPKGITICKIEMMKERERKQAAKLERKLKLAKKSEKLVEELPISENLNRINSISANGIDVSIAALSYFERIKEETGQYDINVFAKKMLRLLRKEHPLWNEGACYEVIGKEWRSAAKLQMQRMRGL